ncbi:MAG: hypothetical protein KJ578_07590 [Bacteroidetes bacterium]|nr:hypothetical protein [Bacteroidota bacterium]
MKNSFKTVWAIALVILVSLSSCKKDDDPTPLSCNLATASAEFSEDSIDVTYKLEATGDAKISSFFYYDETGKVELQNPDFPKEIKITLTQQKSMQAGAVGNVTNGSIKVSFKATTETSNYEGIDQCSQSTN